jgi:Uma2 family endonuclease
MNAPPKRKYTLEEYLELDRNSEERYEYFAGEVFAMAGGSPDHARICGNVFAAIKQGLRGRDCEAFNSEMRVRVPAISLYRYPDASVVCGQPIFEEIQGQQMLLNPILIVEVLSPTTAAFDLNEKFTEYQSVASFQEYLVISQGRPHVIQHQRQGHRRWLRIDTEGMESELTLESLDLTLPLSEIYERVIFQSRTEPQE